MADFDNGATALCSLNRCQYPVREGEYGWFSRIRAFISLVPISRAVHQCGLTYHSQAGLLSAVLTGFIITGVQNRQSNIAEQRAYYMQQELTMLAQISQQISALSPPSQVTTVPPISPPPPSPFPEFKNPLVWMNVFWFSALVISFSAALLAVLVLQWIRNRLYASQQHSGSLKSPRIQRYRGR
jgi:Family of unknown function (DUF6535)